MNLLIIFTDLILALGTIGGMAMMSGNPYAQAFGAGATGLAGVAKASVAGADAISNLNVSGAKEAAMSGLEDAKKVRQGFADYRLQKSGLAPNQIDQYGYGAATNPFIIKGF